MARYKILLPGQKWYFELPFGAQFSVFEIL